ncbi:uncharacterized protein LOC133183496 [Saccostrea echinata]|uniref:uncharacterized protein LOC133183496 n=1 Tax=Saccostrea echinata TaxID=191078 RepID=UPI002A8076BF|nr:uncharacterized protein LOC133183496 [Saccostrea echinata]
MDTKDVVLLKLNDIAEVSVHLHGATIISWKCKAQEVLFVSKNALFDNKKAIRGGIPLVFPCFGPWEKGPQHGFARIKRWRQDSEPKQNNGRASMSFSLEDDEETRKIWDYRFKLVYNVDLGENDLKLTLTVNNNDSKAFDFTTLMHTYFRCPDIADVRIHGLEGLQYNDKVEGGKISTEERKMVTIDKNYDRVYMKCGGDKVQVESIGDGKKSVSLLLSNLTDVVVWNPWEDKAKAMSDFGDDEYKTMICVEAGSVSQSVTAPAGESVLFTQTLKLH